MLERVNVLIKNKKLLSPGDRLVVAVSGGPDSICLLHILHQLSSRWGWSLVVAHLEHGFRADASLGDAAFVRRCAGELGWPVVVEQQDLPGILQEKGGSSQNLSRQLRYRFLQRVAQEHQAQAVLLAHHRDDQAETVLLHLLRGAGASGLAGMAFQEPWRGIKLVRPLLAESRADILDYLRQCELGFRVDVSNTMPDYARNRVRLQILPLLTDLNQDVAAVLARTADVLRAEDNYLAELADEAYAGIRQQEAAALTLDAVAMARLPLALQRRIVRLAWQEVYGSQQDLSFDHVEAALHLLAADVGQSASWPAGWQVRRSYDSLAIHRSGASEAPDDVFELPVPGVVELAASQGWIQAAIVAADSIGQFPADPYQAYCDWQALDTEQLYVRFWQPGDVFYPFGLGGSKKLQDFFVDAKVEWHRRRHIPIVTNGRDIVWVAGHRLDERWRVTASSREVLCLHYIRQSG